MGLYADASRADREAFLRVECDVLVGKPVDSTDLVEWLARAVVRTCRRELDGD